MEFLKSLFLDGFYPSVFVAGLIFFPFVKYIAWPFLKCFCRLVFIEPLEKVIYRVMVTQCFGGGGYAPMTLPYLAGTVRDLESRVCKIKGEIIQAEYRVLKSVELERRGLKPKSYCYLHKDGLSKSFSSRKGYHHNNTKVGPDHVRYAIEDKL